MLTLWQHPLFFVAKAPSLRKTSPGRGKMSPEGDKKGNGCRANARLKEFLRYALLPSSPDGLATSLHEGGLGSAADFPVLP